jgi:hypothetical protein
MGLSLSRLLLLVLRTWATGADDVSSLGDSVEKAFFRRGTKILKIADAFHARRCERPHRFIKKRPAVFVSTLEGIAAVAASKNRLSRDFWGRSIFDLCNSI